MKRTHTSALPLLLLCCTLAAVLSCSRRTADRPPKQTETALARYRDFARSVHDSITSFPQEVCARTLERMRQETDSMAWYHYASIAMKAYFFTFEQDSVENYYLRGVRYFATQPPSHQMADLTSMYHNIMGNLQARLGRYDTAVAYFERAYQTQLKINAIQAPDILMNLADTRIRQGRYDQGAYWYRRALLLCDSLQLDNKKTAVYYGLGQLYMALRNYELCDLYFDLAGERYDSMLTYEQYTYLNNRGNSYYFREDYGRAMDCFRRCAELVRSHPDLAFERNLCYLNMSDIFLKTGQPDSSEIYLKRCRPFFEEVQAATAIYYIDTQELELALNRNDLARASRILNKAKDTTPQEPDMLLIRANNLQRYYEATGNYRQAYLTLKESTRIADSVRSERIRMRVADAALRYTQDSTLMAQNMLIQKKENELLQMRQTWTFWFGLCLLAMTMLVSLYLYNKKKRALQEEQSRRVMSALRLENIRNRLSPHFIFNILNREMASRKQDEPQELGILVKLMRRNLEMSDQLCVSLAEELEFVNTYLELERRPLGTDFQTVVNVAPEVDVQAVRLLSMMIQIPVENAVKHALRGKEGKKLLRIDIGRKDGRGTTVSVTDNGGGYRPDSRSKGTGTGMRIIMQSIQIFNQKNKENIDVSVHNIKLPDGETGCEISFFLPDRYDYGL